MNDTTPEKATDALPGRSSCLRSVLRVGGGLILGALAGIAVGLVAGVGIAMILGVL